jgi:hypothetical protein
LKESGSAATFSDMKNVLNSAASRMALAAFALGLAANLNGADLTAFELIKEGNGYVSKEALDKVIQIRSERSVGGLTPAEWYVTYYDPDATFKATEVKFGAGKKMNVKRPARVWDRIDGTDAALDRKRMRVDSDRAVQIALKQPLLEKLTIKATRLVLDRAGAAGLGDKSLPAWRVELWAAKLSNPNRMTKIGHIILSADDGKVLVTDLNINRVQ